MQAIIQAGARVTRFERAWVQSLNSSTWRRIARSNVVRTTLRSHPVLQANLLRRRVGCWCAGIRHPDRYRDVEAICLFVGHMKSGGTMLGALLDAHPHVAMSDELDVLEYMSIGFRIDEIFHLIERSARREAMKGRVTARRLTPYSFEVPGQWQGRTAGLRVMGDTKAGITTQRLGADPLALERLRQLSDGTRVRLIHVVRNPFDPMSLMRIRGKRSFEGAVERYFENCRILDDIHRTTDPTDIEIVRYEDLVVDTPGTLDRVCDFLGVTPTADYIAACASIIGNPRHERTRVQWSDTEIAYVLDRMAEFDFLTGYTFDHTGRVS